VDDPPRIEWLVVYEIAIASAEPKLAPYLAPSTRTLISSTVHLSPSAKSGSKQLILFNNTSICT
jgi:hypothetical protein